MTDTPPHFDPGDEFDEGHRSGSTTGAPRWVKVFGLIALALVLLVGALFLTGGGGHGPGRHTSSEDAGGQAAPSSVTEPGGAGSGHQPPAGGHAPC